MLDRARLLGKLAELEGYLGQMELLTPADFEAYTADLGTRLACERILQVSIECLLDAAEVLVAGLRLGLPDTERALIQRLAEHGVLDADDARLLRGMQGFRNVLVHRYGTLDQGKVYANLRRAPLELRRLARSLRAAADLAAGKSAPW